MRSHFLAVVVAGSIGQAVAAGSETLDVDPTRPGRQILHVCAADGTPLRPLVNDEKLRNRLGRQGTPDVSPDGTWVAFDAWPAEKPGAWHEARVIVVRLDGTGPIDIGDGVMPSFSPGNDDLVVSRPPKYAKADGAKGQSIWITPVEGGSMQMIADRGAWGGRWSPDGRSIVFHGGVDEDGKKVPKTALRLYDLATDTIKTLFTPKESPFKRVSYHFAWAHDRRRVAFGGLLKDGTPATAVLDVDGDDGPVVRPASPADGPRPIHGFAYEWWPDDATILLPAATGNGVGPATLGIDGTISTDRFGGLPENVVASDLAVAPDGEHLVLALRPKR